MLRLAMRWGTRMAILPSAKYGNAPTRLADAVLPPRVRRALESLLKDARSELARQLPQVLHETELSLLRSSPKTATKLEAANHVSVRSLNKGEQAFCDRFMVDVEASLATILLRASHAGDASAEPAVLTLSLLDEEVVSDESVLETMASRIESRNSLNLQLLGQRFGVLAGAPAFEGDALPLGPHALSRALAEAADTLELSRYARVQLFRHFEQVVMGSYPQILDGFNNRMVENGILPHLRFVPVRPRQPVGGDGDRTAPQPSRASQPTAGQHGAAQAGPSQGGTSHHSAPAAGAHPGGGGGASGMHQPHVQGADAVHASPTGSGGTQFAALQGLLKRRRVLLAKLRPGGQDDRVREPLQQTEVLDSLQRMRSNGTQADSVSDYRQILLAQARQMHGHGVALADADNDAFELLTLFMAQLQRDMRKSSPGDTLVGRLRLPLLQLALRDHRFFIDQGHPARRILNAASLAGARWLGEDDLDPQWLGLLQRAVATAQQDGDAGHDAFVEANHTLQAGLQGLARKAEMAERRQVEAARGREKLLLARQRAADEIAGALRGRSLPRFQGILIDQAWADVLSLTFLRNGEDSEAWQHLLQATQRIVQAATSDSRTAPDGQFLGQVRSALEQVGYHAEDARAIAAQLVDGSSEEADLASRTELLVQLRARTRLGEGSEAASTKRNQPRSVQEQEAFDRLRLLEEPVWVEIEGESGHQLRRRLAWVSPRTGQTLLVNRRGQRIASDDLDTLARHMAAGRMRLLSEDLAPAEAAWDSTTNSLQRIAESNSLGGMEASNGH